MTTPKSRSELVLDLFAGPGGWDEGIRPLGIRPVGIELDELACRTAMAAGHTRVRADVATLPTQRMRGKVTGMIASPPCQDFSIAGAKAGIDGEKGKLLRQVWRWASELTPEWIACEQVPAVLPYWENYAWQLRGLGYSTWTGVIDAADYGVPQSRERAVLLASRVRPVTAPEPTHAEREEPAGLFGAGREQWRSIEDARPERAGWELHGIRGSGMVDRHGERPGRRSDQPAFCVMAWKDSRQVWKRDEAKDRYTLADALAFQTFPSDYPVQGSSTRAHEQIGNAVPPRMALHVIAAVLGVPVPVVQTEAAA